jgi:tetraprenyl-beta-curcumene synthase
MPVSALGNRGLIPTLGDRRLVARAGLALLLANVRYWTSVAPVVRRELRHWELCARAIEDSELRALALEKLSGERFHAEAAAMLATLAPRAHRRYAVEAIVALELLFDYLDGLTERPSGDPLGDGERLFEAYTDALAADSESNGNKPGSDNYDSAPRAKDGGYLEALSGTVRAALERLPATGAITEVALASAARSAQAQIRMHAASRLGAEQVEQWARREAEGTGLQWRELLAGAASSVLAVHALIAAAADPDTTREEAIEIEAAYLSTCVLLTLLDGLVDHNQDTQAGEGSPAGGTGQTGDSSRAGGIGGAAGLGYLSFYEDPDELSQTLTDAAQRAAAQARALPNGPHHAMMLVGVVAYYTSAPGAQSELAAPIVKRLQRQLQPLIFPTLWVMRSWQLAKRMREGSYRRLPAIRGLTSSTGKSRRRGGCNEI